MVSKVSGIYLLGFAPYKIVKIGKANDLKRRLDNYYYQAVHSFPSKAFDYDHALIERVAGCIFLVGFVPTDAGDLDDCESQHLKLARKHLSAMSGTKEWFQTPSLNYETVRQMVGIHKPCQGSLTASIVKKYILSQA